jgi:hypothetical protein
MQRGSLSMVSRKEGPAVWSESRNASDGTRFATRYSTLLRSVGTEFKVMQELLRHSTLRSTLDVYTQAITPAKHPDQAAVLSFQVTLRREHSRQRDEKGHKKGAKTCPFGSSMVSAKSA